MAIATYMAIRINHLKKRGNSQIKVIAKDCKCFMEK